jgi:hypothetical protein
MTSSTKFAGLASLLQGILFLLVPINLAVLQSAIGFTTANDWIDQVKIRANFWPLMVTPLIQFGLCAVVIVVALVLYDHMGSSSSRLMRLSVLAAVVAISLLLLSATLEVVYRSLLGTSSYLAENQALVLSIQKDLAGTARVAGFFALGWSTLLWSWAGIRNHMLSRPLCFTALLSGILAIVLPLIPLFVIIYIIWSFWLGVTLLNKNRRPVIVSAPNP